MALRRNVKRIDHLAVLVRPENFESCVDRLTKLLDLSFVRAEREDLGLLIAADWDSGFEVLAPTGPESLMWQRLVEDGEGQISIIFGVGDVDAAADRARAVGMEVGPEVGLRGDEPWFDRFDTVREQPLMESIHGLRIMLGEIRPTATELSAAREEQRGEEA